MPDNLQQPIKNSPSLNLRTWARGDAITASRLNEPLRALQSITRGVAPPVQVIRSPILARGGFVGGLFPVKLVKTSGSAGSAGGAASWKYSAFDNTTNELLGADIRISQSPLIGTQRHHWIRPSRGRMTAANFGIAYYDDQNRLVLTWINEQVEQQACLG